MRAAASCVGSAVSRRPGLVTAVLMISFFPGPQVIGTARSPCAETTGLLNTVNRAHGYAGRLPWSTTVTLASRPCRSLAGAKRASHHGERGGQADGVARSTPP